MGTTRRTLAVWLAGVTFTLAAPQPTRAQGTDLDNKIAETYRAVYNLDQDVGMSTARALLASAPNESRAHRTLAAVLWIDVIFRRGAVTIDQYLGSIGKSDINMPKPPPALDAEFKQEIGRAIDLANARLAANPSDLQAKYDLGSAYGLQASYLASVEGKVTSAFLSARRAYDAQEDVLTRDPKRVGAGVVVGTYRYMVAGLSLPSRMFAYMMGFGGDKERGISMIEAASKDPDSHVEAKLALILIYSREGRHADALKLLGDLASEFPRNRILVLEQGSASLRAGRYADAESFLTHGLDLFNHDVRRKIPGERALWLYKRGVARLYLNHRPDATADLSTALQAEPENWVRGRIRLAQGKLDDLDGKRPAALNEYRIARDIATTAGDPACAAEAARWLKLPFLLPPRS